MNFHYTHAIRICQRMEYVCERLANAKFMDLDELIDAMELMHKLHVIELVNACEPYMEAMNNHYPKITGVSTLSQMLAHFTYKCEQEELDLFLQRHQEAFKLIDRQKIKDFYEKLKQGLKDAKQYKVSASNVDTSEETQDTSANQTNVSSVKTQDS